MDQFVAFYDRYTMTVRVHLWQKMWIIRLLGLLDKCFGMEKKNCPFNHYIVLITSTIFFVNTVQKFGILDDLQLALMSAVTD